MAIQSPTERFYLEVRAAEDHVYVAVSGPLDLSTVVDLQQLATALPGTSGPVVLDLVGLTFLDSTGISALAGFKAELDVQLRRLSVVNVSPRILDVLRMAGMDASLGVSG